MACLARIEADADQERLRRLQPPGPVPVLDIWLAVHRDNRNTSRIRTVLDAIAVAMREQTEALDPP